MKKHLLLFLVAAFVPSAFAIKIVDFARPRDETPIAKHQIVGRRDYEKRVLPMSDHTHVPEFEAKVLPTKTTIPRGQLFYYSFLFNVDVTRSDFLMISRNASDADLGTLFYYPKFNDLVRDGIVGFKSDQIVTMTPGLEAALVKRASYYPDRKKVSYRGPVAIQALTREFQNRREGSTLHDVLAEPVAYIGLEITWRNKRGTYESSELLAAVDSSEVGLVPGQLQSSLRTDFKAEDKILLLERIRRSARGSKGTISIHLLTSDLATIAEYPMDKAQARALIKEAAGKRTVIDVCGQWLGSTLSRKTYF